MNSMSDLFHPDVSDVYIEKVTSVMRVADWHIFQVLTKRSERMRKLLSTRLHIGSTIGAHLVGREC